MTSPEKEQEAVGEVLFKLGRCFAQTSTEGLAEIYTKDADWTNAFGTTRHGRENIVAYLEKLFANQHFGAGELVGKPQGDIRLITDDIAVAKTYIKRQGQQTKEGDEIPIRRNHSLKILKKEEGQWKILSEIYMDARNEESGVF